MNSVVPRSTLLLLLCFVGCSDAASSVSGTAGRDETGADTETTGEESMSAASTGASCPPLELLDPGELLPDGQTLQEFEQTWGGTYQAGLDWSWAVDGVVPSQYGGITEAMLSLDVRFAQRILDGCDEVGLEVESALALSTADGAFDELWTVRWTYEDDGWTTSLELPSIDGALDYGTLGGGAEVEALLVDLYLRPSGALAALVYTRGTGPSAVLVNGLAAIGGVHEAAECEGFDGFDPSCAPAGCAAILATPVTDACDCLTARTLCFGTEPAPTQTGLFWRDVDGVREVFAASVELAAETSWNVCTPGDAPACACEGACG